MHELPDILKGCIVFHRKLFKHKHDWETPELNGASNGIIKVNDGLSLAIVDHHLAFVRILANSAFEFW